MNRNSSINLMRILFLFFQIRSKFWFTAGDFCLQVCGSTGGTARTNEGSSESKQDGDSDVTHAKHIFESSVSSTAIRNIY